ncbi:MAG: polyphosphate kinase 1 [Spirochaetaceae bacterium]|nr:MAG: polyphosphate kinase 1 [Spirochaetaceae bacterium]
MTAAPCINRELSWLEFNARVLAEAENPDVPLLERLRFLAIVSSNFDEFFMVRVATVRRQLLAGQSSTCPTGISPRAQLAQIHRRCSELTRRMYGTLTGDVLPGMAREGLVRVPPGEWNDDQHEHGRTHFRQRVLPVLTPVRVVPGEPLTTVRNLALTAAFLLEPLGEAGPPWPWDEAQPGPAEEHPLIVLVQVPPTLDRIVYLPEGENQRVAFTFLEQLILKEGAQLFPGYTVRDSCLFRVTRDADLSVDEERDEDFLEAMEQVLETRERSHPVRLSINDRSDRLRTFLTGAFGLDKQEVYVCPDPLELNPLMQIAATEGFDHLRNKPWRALPSPGIDRDEPVWEAARRRDVMLHLPYESFDPVVRLVREAAADENTLAIKITLYRVSADSPIVRALESAAQKGKQVTVLVELKARFDEQTNIDLAQRLQRAGAIVIHGIARLKVHAKALLVIRQGTGGIERYAYLSTGNYNDRTATLYGDIGLFTAREEITTEMGLFFNAVTGYSVIPGLRKLVLAPGSLRPRLLELIRRERGRAEARGKGLIIAKMNSLADPELIEELYTASQQGVRILLNVRGICMLVPGVEGISTGIRVVSIVDRYLEHSRIFFFENGGAEETYLSSADWMPRNLDRRVELMFPVEDPAIRRRIREVLDTYFADTVKAHELGPDHQWKRIAPKKKATPLRAQAEIYRRVQERAAAEEPENREVFSVRRRNTGGGNG